MFAGGGGNGNSNPRGPPPGFFQGVYGGPRMQVQMFNPPPVQNYNFLKCRGENLDSSSEQEKSSIRAHAEPLNDEILEGCANLFDQTGKRVQVILRDGRILVGELASVDHFSNVLLRDAVERIVVGKQYGDIRRGIFIIRGDNLVLVGEVDGEQEAEMERVLEQIPTDEILFAQKFVHDSERAKQSKYVEALKQRGVSFPKQLDDEF